MTNPNTEPSDLLPCRHCGAAGRRHDFSVGPVWLCSNNHVLLGDCPDQQAYLSADVWNDRHARLTEPSERDREVAEETVSSANIVTCDGYYEVDIDAVCAVIATYRAEIEAAAEQRVKAEIVAWLRKQSDIGAERGIEAAKGTTKRAAYGGGSLALERAADAIERNEQEIRDGE